MISEKQLKKMRPQNEVLSWLTQIQVIPNHVTCILLWNSFGSYWPPLYFIQFNGSQRNQNCLVNNIFQNIFFYVPHTSLEWCEWVMRDHIIFFSGGTIPQHFEHFLTQSYCMASKYILCVCVCGVCFAQKPKSYNFDEKTHSEYRGRWHSDFCHLPTIRRCFRKRPESWTQLPIQKNMYWEWIPWACRQPIPTNRQNIVLNVL